MHMWNLSSSVLHQQNSHYFKFYLKDQGWKQSQRLCQRSPAAFTDWPAHLQSVENYDDDGDIYIMMSVCLSVCNKKSSLPPVSLL